MDKYARRVTSLEKNINDALQLLGEYENLVLREDEPSRRMTYRKKIGEIHAEMERWEDEYRTLNEKVPTSQSDRVHEVGVKLEEVNSKLCGLSAQMHSIKENIGDLQLAIMTCFEASKQPIIGPILEGLPHSQLQDILAAVKGTAEGVISEDESKEIVILVQKALSEFQNNLAMFPDLQPSEIQNVSNAIDDPKLGLESRLELSIPIIPFILRYKTMAKLTSGANLEKMWQWLKGKFRNKG